MTPASAAQSTDRRVPTSLKPWGDETSGSPFQRQRRSIIPWRLIAWLGANRVAEAPRTIPSSLAHSSASRYGALAGTSVNGWEVPAG
jgi:hypothetical protein